MSEENQTALAEIFTPPLPGEWGSEPQGEGDVLVLRAADFTKDCKLRNEVGVPRFVPAMRLANRILKNGDLLVEASGGSPNQPAGRVARFNRANDSRTYSFSNFLQRLQTNPDFDPLFSYYLLVFRYNSGKVLRYQQQTTGIINFKLEQYLKDRVTVPPRPTQRKIARILQKADAAMEKTEALIEKYQQIKAGLMHDLFTRGLWTQEELDRGDHQGTPVEATAKAGQLRPSRLDAPQLYHETPIGWIPKTWALLTCSEVCEAVIDCKNRTPPITPEGHPVIRTPNVRDGRFVERNLVFTDSHSYVIWTYRGKPKPGDIVITREAPVGEVCRIPERHPQSCLGQRMMLYRTNPEKIVNEFFLFALQSNQIQTRLDLISGGSTVGHVRVGDIRSLWVFLPESKIEQSRVAEALSNASLKLEAEDDCLLKLQKQKAGLMHDLLTGKVPITPDHEEANDV